MFAMEVLPEDVVSKIAGYLDSRDVMSASLVCKRWREAFNIDAVWTPRLQFPSKYYNIQEKYKDMILCPPSYPSLEPLCVARECYIRDQCLIFNCRSGLCTFEGIIPKTAGVIVTYVDVLDEEGNYWIFLNTSYAVEVWNITNKPFLHDYKLKELSPTEDRIYVLDTKVILICFNIVRIYTFEHPKFELTFHGYFLFDSEFPIIGQEPLSPDHVLQRQFNHILADNILVGFTTYVSKAELMTASMHIWDLASLIKLKSMSVLSENFINHYTTEGEHEGKSALKIDMHLCGSKGVFIVVIDLEHHSSKILIFSLESLMFYSFFKFCAQTIVQFCSFVDDRIVLIGWSWRNAGFVSLVDISGRDIVTRNFNRYGIESNGGVLFNLPWLYIKNGDSISLLEIKNKPTLTTVLEYSGLNKDAAKVLYNFVFTKSSNLMATRLWDKELHVELRELPDIKFDIDIESISSLKASKFPPKVICINVEKNAMIVLSFW